MFNYKVISTGIDAQFITYIANGNININKGKKVERRHKKSISRAY
jgi:hypothetical protein